MQQGFGTSRGASERQVLELDTESSKVEVSQIGRLTRADVAGDSHDDLVKALPTLMCWCR